ncbi:hypothetical protein BRD56_05995 [Thermoplasmatales archaeon SW_10_69_26]|nr:MAG: hypothetical protein BRD56_05995 [Thermoplasmatales archaeon SW_10_69_26]
MSVPSVDYLENMESGNYQRATQDDELREAWEEENDALARSLLLVAEVHRDAALGNTAGAITSANEAEAVLQDEVEEGFQRKALLQHLDQCKEYVKKSKSLPELPGGI